MILYTKTCPACGGTFAKRENEYLAEFKKRMFCSLACRYKRTPPEERFWAKVDATGICWEWTGAISDTGYGSFNTGDSYMGAHKFAYTTLVGPVPAGLHLDHLCCNRKCVNPDHLEPVDMEENWRRAGFPRGTNHARKTHCIHGHEFTPENIERRPELNPKWRVCRTCHLERAKESYQRRRQARKGEAA